MGAKGDNTKQKIMDTAYEIFAKYGYKDVTMKDICEATGLSRGGLYRHFSCTEDILMQILSVEITFDDKLLEGVSAVEVLDEMLLACEQEMLDKEKSLSLAIYELASTGKQDFFAEINNRAINRWCRLIQYGMDRGEFKKVDPRTVAELILYSYQGVRMWSGVMNLGPDTAHNIIVGIRQMLI
ncbi:MAG: TetR/AcrR family transcriptional regulator [Butyrivibrio sp.]|nr:TetR/AcrR family transcriptional regulator [Butyrivibrio sp.]